MPHHETGCNGIRILKEGYGFFAMSEKEPNVTFIDRRKISSEGEIRPEAREMEEAEAREAQKSAPPAAPPPTASTPQPTAKAKAEPARAKTSSASENVPEAPTEEETAESRDAYNQTTQKLDEILRDKAPDASRLGPVGFEHLVQSMYMTAMVGLGAGTPVGEKPRIDLMGSRQTIDLLAVLQEKTKNNLTEGEQRLLESALFELRMTFLEVTNAIAQNAAHPAETQPSKRK